MKIEITLKNRDDQKTGNQSQNSDTRNFKPTRGQNGIQIKGPSMSIQKYAKEYERLQAKDFHFKPHYMLTNRTGLAVPHFRRSAGMR